MWLVHSSGSPVICISSQSSKGNHKRQDQQAPYLSATARSASPQCWSASAQSKRRVTPDCTSDCNHDNSAMVCHIVQHQSKDAEAPQLHSATFRVHSHSASRRFSPYIVVGKGSAGGGGGPDSVADSSHRFKLRRRSADVDSIHDDADWNIQDELLESRDAFRYLE